MLLHLALAVDEEQMPIPLDKIIEAAEKAGFATELRAASILTRSKWTVRQNVYYIDKDEGKGRELDLRSFRIFSSTSEKPEVTCMVTLCIEVKKTADPFIFYTSEKDKWELGGGTAYATGKAMLLGMFLVTMTSNCGVHPQKRHA